MALQILWLLTSHAAIIVAGSSLLKTGFVLIGVVLAFVVPIVRITGRFSPYGGYRLFVMAEQGSGQLVRPGVDLTRQSHHSFFWLYLTIETGIVAVIMLRKFVF